MAKLKYSEKRKKLLEKKNKRKIQKGIPVKGPSEEQVKTLLNYMNLDRQEDAKELASSITENSRDTLLAGRFWPPSQQKEAKRAMH